MSALVYQGKRLDPDGSMLVATFIRIFTNLLFVLFVASASGNLKTIFGNGAPELWLRGVFGSASLACFFYSIHTIGVGESSLLQGGNGVWVALLSPILLKTRNPWIAWFAIFIAIAGLFLLYQPKAEDVYPLGRLAGLSSGVLSALAYVMIARGGSENSIYSVVFYFCLVGTIVHALAFLFIPVTLPTRYETYWYLIAAGLCASLGQMFLTKGYQITHPSLAAATGYSAQVFNLIIGVTVFGDVLTQHSVIGAGLVIFGGVILPFLGESGRKVKSV